MEKNNEIIDNLVSIIMPAYNSEEFIEQSIRSVQSQLYKHWELIIVDDCSTDKTVQIIKSIRDERIKLIALTENRGAAYARNIAIKEAKGEFLAFLDSDDLWTSKKLSSQIMFMKKNNYSFTCTEYAHMNEQRKIVNIVKNYDELDYNGVLKYCPGNSTVVYNVKVLGKTFIPDIKRRNDFVMWLQVIKKAKRIYGLKETLTVYRVRSGSLSNSKIKLVKYQWKVYREIENLSLLKSLYLLGHKIFMIVFETNKLKRE